MAAAAAAASPASSGAIASPASSERWQAEVSDIMNQLRADEYQHLEAIQGVQNEWAEFMLVVQQHSDAVLKRLDQTEWDIQ